MPKSILTVTEVSPPLKNKMTSFWINLFFKNMLIMAFKPVH